MTRLRDWVLIVALVSSPGFAVEVSKAQWLSAMKTALPTVLCHSSQYFRLCFDVTASECEAVAYSATRICLQDFSSSIPAILNQPEDGTRWGSQVGECAGNAYEIALFQKKISSQACNDPLNWQ